MPPSQSPIGSDTYTPSYQSSYHTCYDQTQYSQNDAYNSSQNNFWNNIPDSQASNYSNGDDTLSLLIKQNDEHRNDNNN